MKMNKKILIICLAIIIVLGLAAGIFFFVPKDKKSLEVNRDDKVKIYHTEEDAVYYLSEKDDFEIYSDFRKIDKYVSVEYDIELDGGIEINGIRSDYTDYVTLNGNHVKIDLKKCFEVTEERDGKYCPLAYNATLNSYKDAGFTLKNITLYDKDGNKYLRKDKKYKPDFGGGDVYLCKYDDKIVHYSYKNKEGCTKTEISFDAGNHIMDNVFTDKYILLYSNGEYKVYDVMARSTTFSYKYNGKKENLITYPTGYSIKEMDLNSKNYGEVIGFINNDKLAINFKNGKSITIEGYLEQPNDSNRVFYRYYSANHGHLVTNELVYNLDKMKYFMINEETIQKDQENVRKYKYFYTDNGAIEVDTTKYNSSILGKTNKVFIGTIDGKAASLVEADNKVLTHEILLNKPREVYKIVGLENIPNYANKSSDDFYVSFVEEENGFEDTMEETEYLVIATSGTHPNEMIRSLFKLNKNTGDYEYYNKSVGSVIQQEAS